MPDYSLDEPSEIRYSCLTELTSSQDYEMGSVRYETIYQLSFWTVNLLGEESKGGKEGSQNIPPQNMPF